MLKEKLLEDLKNAMKDKNVNKKNTIQMVRASVLQVEKDKKIELNDNDILEVIAKEFKKRNDALVEYEKSGREDLINQIKEEMAVLEEYLPKKLSEEELGVTADGRMINEIVKKLLS